MKFRKGLIVLLLIGVFSTGFTLPASTSSSQPLLEDSGQRLGSNTTIDIELGDFDDDGDLDILAINDSTYNKVWLNDGSGTFTDSGIQISGNQMFDAEIGDFNNDSIADAFATGIGNSFQLRGTGSASLLTTAQSLPSSGNAVDIADFDGDNDIDAYIGLGSGLSSTVYVNNNGSFVATSQINLNTTTVVEDVEAGDVDNDGDIDVILGNCANGQPGLQIMTNDGAAQFTVGYGLGTCSDAIAVGDVNNDQNLDFIVSYRISNSASVFFGDGQGGINGGSQLSQTGNWASDLELGDVDGDGDLDIFMANTAFGNVSKVYLNDGLGTFSAPIDFGSNTAANALAIGDLDGDGDLDVVEANHSNNANYVYLNTSPAELNPFQRVVSPGVWGWEHFEMNGDTYLAVANASYTDPSVLLKWDGTSFIQDQTFINDRVTDFEYFEIGGESYLLMARYKNGSTYNAVSVLYKWDGVDFVAHQNIVTEGVMDIEYFEFDDSGTTREFVAISNYYAWAGGYQQTSKILEWNDQTEQFDQFQLMNVPGAHNFEFMELDGEYYLAAAGYYDGSSFYTDSFIYKWDSVNNTFNLHQTIPVKGATDLHHFSYDGNDYIGIANYYPTSQQDSEIYKWDSVIDTFVLDKSVATSGAHGWETFEFNNDLYLVVSEHYNGVTSDVDSSVYRWTPTGLEETQLIDTNGATGSTAFTIGNVQYVAFANYYNGWTLDNIFVVQ